MKEKFVVYNKGENNKILKFNIILLLYSPFVVFI